MGERRDLNPRIKESQSNALPLGHARHLFFFIMFRFTKLYQYILLKTNCYFKIYWGKVKTRKYLFQHYSLKPSTPRTCHYQHHHCRLASLTSICFTSKMQSFACGTSKKKWNENEMVGRYEVVWQCGEMHVHEWNGDAPPVRRSATVGFDNLRCKDEAMEHVYCIPLCSIPAVMKRVEVWSRKYGVAEL